MMLLDYHVHPDYSIDAGGTMKEYAQKALEKGMSEICFTTHLDLVPERIHLDGFVRVGRQYLSVQDDWLPSYFAEIAETQNEYSPKGLQIIAGVEIDYHPEIVDQIKRIVDNHPFDYVLGAVHSLDGYSIAVPEDCHEFCRGKTPEEVCRRYFSLVVDAVGTGLFDALAHLDLYKRFSYSIYGNEIDKAHKPVWDEVLEAFANTGTGIEINTGNWRKGLAQPSPSADQMHELIQSAVTIVTVGSDAHLPHLVGRDIDRAIAFAKEAGCRGIFSYRDRKPQIAISFSAAEISEEQVG